jgi:hypothetical protein
MAKRKKRRYYRGSPILSDEDIKFIRQVYDLASNEGWTFTEYARQIQASGGKLGSTTIATWCYATNEGLKSWCKKTGRKYPRGPMVSTLTALGRPFGLVPTYQKIKP